MNKYVIEALRKYEFEFTNKHGYGFIDDYEVNVIDKTPFCAPILIFSTYLKLSDRHIFKSKFKSYKIRLTKPFAFDYGVAVKIDCLRGKTFLKKIPEVIEIVLSILKYMGAKKKNICPASGIELNDENSRLYEIPNDNIKVRLSEATILQTENKNKNQRERKSSYLLGFLGILIGGSIAETITVISSYTRFTTVIVAAMVSIYVGTLLYQKFGGKRNYIMVIMSFVTTTLSVLGAFMIVMMLEASVVAKNDLVELYFFDALNFCLEYNQDFAKHFFSSLIAVCSSLFIAELSFFFVLNSQIKTPRSLK